MTITRHMRLTLLALLAVAAMLPAHAQDVLTIGSTTTMSGSGPVSLPISIRDVSGTRLGTDTTRIQAMALKVDITPASAVAAASIVRAGVAAGLTPLFERTGTTTGGDTLSVHYVISFDATSQPLPLVLNSAAPGNQVASLNITLASGLNAGTEMIIAVDRERTLLANETGAIAESAFNRALTFVDGEVEVDGHVTTTTLVTSPNPSTTGESVTMTATVSSAVSGSITGTVAFRNGSAILARVAVSSGQASLTRSDLPAGTHQITASYEGNPAYRSSTSGAVSQVVSLPPFGAPQSLTATATSANAVTVTWTPVAAVQAYEIRRRSTVNGAFSHRGYVYPHQNTTTFIDSVAPNVTYIYAVRAHGNSTVSPNSPVDYATSVIFVNDPLTVGTTVRLQHLTQLRTAVNAFRTTAGLPAAVFTDPTPTTQTRPKAAHVTELRTALNEARTALGFSQVSFTGVVVPGMAMSTSHFQEIRNAVK